MHDWLEPPSDPVVAVTGPTTHQGTALRLLDLTLACLAVLALILAWPLTLLAWLRATSCRVPSHGRHGQRVDRVRWVYGYTVLDRLLRGLGASQWPTLWHILVGDMAWVGPRARALDEAPSPVLAVRPGWFGLHGLRRATAVDFMNEARSDVDYLAQRGVGHDLRLLLLCVWHARLGGRRQRAESTASRVRVVDVWVDNLDMDGALDEVRQRLERQAPTQVSFANPACINIAARRADYRRVLARSDLVLPDGIGMKIASNWLGTPIRQNVNGTDFVPRLLRQLSASNHLRETRVFLLGARPEVVAEVVRVIATRWPSLQVVGSRHGYFDARDEAGIARTVRDSGAQLLLVALGAPLQEAFIARNLSRLGPCVAIGVGGLFDFMSGRVSRAPRWMRDAGLEWVWRLLQEPGRMWRRYLIGNLSFLCRVRLQKLKLRSPREVAPDQLTPTPGAACAAVPGAVILATETFHGESNGPLAATFPLGPGSFVETTVASLVARGVRCIHLIVPRNHPGSAELHARLRDGRRWGARITWHLSASPDEPLEPLRALAQTAATPMLLVAGHTWLRPALHARLMRERQMATRIDERGNSSWMGWACVEPADLSALAGCADLDAAGAALLERTPTRLLLATDDVVSAADTQALLQAQRQALVQDLVALQTDVWVSHPWGLVSADAHVSPKAVIHGPVCIGPGSVVRAGACLGPNVTLAHNALIDKGAILANAVVLSGAYVGTRFVTPGGLRGELPLAQAA